VSDNVEKRFKTGDDDNDRKIAKSDYQLHYVCQSARPHGDTRLPLDGFSRNLILEGVFRNIC
jgi:hypothetical protein